LHGGHSAWRADFTAVAQTGAIAAAGKWTGFPLASLQVLRPLADQQRVGLRRETKGETTVQGGLVS
jgi:hypothetical protein